MDEHLEGLLDTLEILCESACDAYEPYKAWPGIEKKIQEIREYAKDMQKCNNSYHHDEGHDCCN